ncbi:MAG: hypothetical protein P0119_08725 [Nitrospira sp.]|nr:hypothetical protein [Nitrospira sp.]
MAIRPDHSPSLTRAAHDPHPFSDAIAIGLRDGTHRHQLDRNFFDLARELERQLIVGRDRLAAVLADAESVDVEPTCDGFFATATTDLFAVNYTYVDRLR